MFICGIDYAVIGVVGAFARFSVHRRRRRRCRNIMGMAWGAVGVVVFYARPGWLDGTASIALFGYVSTISVRRQWTR